MGKFLIFLVALVFSGLAHAQLLTQEQKLRDFDTLTSAIQNGYGPLHYKTEKGIVNIPQLIAEYRERIARTQSNRDFYYTMIKFVAAFKDGHFGMYVPTTHVASIAIVTDLMDGKVVITNFDASKLPARLNLKVGEEIESIDGMPIQEFLDKTSEYIAYGNPNAVRRIAAWSVFHRRGSNVPVPTESNASIRIRSQNGRSVRSVAVPWTFSGQPLDEVFMQPLGMGRMNGARASINFDMLASNIAQYTNPQFDRTFACSGETRIAIPKDATVIMRDPFVAYYHPTPKGNVGYLRIPHYMPQVKPGQGFTDAALEWMSQYEFAIRELERNTVGLIIDQDHNCGGSVWVVNQMVALFMDKPFLPMQFELLANKESYLAFNQWLTGTSAHTIDREDLLGVLELVRSTWLKGESFLTTKTAIDGLKRVEPRSIRYTKPVVMLVDDMAGSGGDAFPSMMQGLGRARLFGQTTGGLGGHVQRYPAPLPHSQMTFSMTKSLFYRPDGVAVENNGAVPNMFYNIGRENLLNGFTTYQKAYVEYLLGFVK